MSRESKLLLEQSIYGLLSKLPWYGTLLQGMKQSISTEIPTLGVRFAKNGRSVELMINPEFFAKLTYEERIACLIHEARHVDSLHLVRIPMATTNARMGNVAADLAINCYIEHLPEGALQPEKLGFDPHLTFEHYLKLLKDDQEQQEGGGQSQGLDSFDSHNWGSEEMAVGEQVATIEGLLKSTVDRLGENSSNIPQHVREALKQLEGMKTKNWHRELKRFLGRTVHAYEQERTWSRRNRRYGLWEAGNKMSLQKKLAVLFDASGSISNADFEKYLTETLGMLKQGVTGHILQFDTHVTDIQPLRKAKIHEIEIVGRGGTNFVEAFEKADQLGCDGIVIFTDGEDYGEMARRPNTPVLWVLTHGHNGRYDWGFKTFLD